MLSLAVTLFSDTRKVMLLVLETIRYFVNIAKVKVVKPFEKYKIRKGANEADKKEE